MTQMFKEYMKMALDGSINTQKRFLESKRSLELLPANAMVRNKDGTTANIRELLQMSSVEGTNLIAAEVRATVLEGAEPAKCVRTLFPLMPMQSSVMSVPYGETGTYAPEVASGARYFDKEIDYSTATITAKKYGVAIRITDEMIADALVDVMNIEVQKAGLRCENTLNQVVANAIIVGAGGAQDLAGANLNTGGIALAMTKMRGNQFVPDALMVCPDLMGKLIQDQLPLATYWKMADEGVRGGLIANILGLKVGMYSGTYTGATYTYRFTTNDDVGGVLIDSKAGAMIGMRNDLQVEGYRDVLSGLKGATVNIRFGTSVILSNGLCRIQY